MTFGAMKPRLLPEPLPPTTSTLRLRSQRGSWSGRSKASEQRLVSITLARGSLASAKRLISAGVAQRALPCSSPLR